MYLWKWHSIACHDMTWRWERTVIYWVRFCSGSCHFFKWRVLVLFGSFKKRVLVRFVRFGFGSIPISSPVPSHPAGNTNDTRARWRPRRPDSGVLLFGGRSGLSARPRRPHVILSGCMSTEPDRHRCRQHKAEDYNIITGYRHSIAFYTVCAVLRRPPVWRKARTAN